MWMLGEGAANTRVDVVSRVRVVSRVGTDALRPFSDKRGRAWPLTFVTTGLSGFARVALPNVRSALRPGM